MNDFISREAVLQKFFERGSGYIDMLTMKTMIDEIPSVDVQPVKLIQRIVQGRLNGANYTLFEADISNDTNTAYKMRGAINICCEILADLRALTAMDGEQNG